MLLKYNPHIHVQNTTTATYITSWNEVDRDCDWVALLHKQMKSAPTLEYTYTHAQCTHTYRDRDSGRHTFMSCSTIDSLLMRFYHRKMFAQMRFNNCLHQHVDFYSLKETKWVTNVLQCTHAHTYTQRVIHFSPPTFPLVCVYVYGNTPNVK